MDNQVSGIKMDNIPKRLFKKRAVLIVIAVVFAVGVLVYLGIAIKIPSNPLNLLQRKAEVKLKTEYKNPFSKETQYVNPFETYKNPFVVNR